MYLRAELVGVSVCLQPSCLPSCKPRSFPSPLQRHTAPLTHSVWEENQRGFPRIEKQEVARGRWWWRRALTPRRALMIPPVLLHSPLAWCRPPRGRSRRSRRPRPRWVNSCCCLFILMCQRTSSCLSFYHLLTSRSISEIMLVWTIQDLTCIHYIDSSDKCTYSKMSFHSVQHLEMFASGL